MEQLDGIFRWNRHGVCVNPEEKSYCDKHCCVRIYLAKFRDKWYFGTSFGIHIATKSESCKYGSELPSYRSQGYTLKSTAIGFAYEKLKSECSGSELLMQCLQEAGPLLLQLELF